MCANNIWLWGNFQEMFHVSGSQTLVTITNSFAWYLIYLVVYFIFFQYDFPLTLYNSSTSLSLAFFNSFIELYSNLFCIRPWELWIHSPQITTNLPSVSYHFSVQGIATLLIILRYAWGRFISCSHITFFNFSNYIEYLFT